MAGISGGHESNKGSENIAKVIPTRVQAESFNSLEIRGGNQEIKEERAIAVPEWERISQSHAAFLLHIDSKLLREWKKQEEEIVESVKGAWKVTRRAQPRWEELEVKLHYEFKETRKHGRSVNRKWFERVGKDIFASIYPQQVGYNENHEVVFDLCVF